MFDTIRFILEFARHDFLSFIVTIIVLVTIGVAISDLFKIDVTINKNDKEKKKEINDNE